MEYGKANMFTRYFIHDYMRDYGDNCVIGKVYPGCAFWFEHYTVDLDDLMGPNLVMVNRGLPDLVRLLGA